MKNLIDFVSSFAFIIHLFVEEYTCTRIPYVNMIKLAFEKLRNFNIYKQDNILEEDNPAILRDHIRSTRVFLCLFIIIITIITFYTILVPNDIFITVTRPTLETYRNLQAINSDSLSCLCENSAVPYSSFISVDPIYHQVSWKSLSWNIYTSIWLDLYFSVVCYINIRISPRSTECILTLGLL